MTTSDTKVIKALTNMGLRSEVPLTPEQERMFQQATDPNEAYLHKVEQLFNNSPDKVAKSK